MLFSIMMRGGYMHSVLVGLLCLAIASCCSSSSVGSSNNTILCLENERLALLQFKQGLVHGYDFLGSWESTEDCCDWIGITCNNHTGHVISLDLSVKYLTGEIHPSLLELRYLEYLDLSYNDFQGSKIPKFIGSLSQLKELKLARANFSGHVPPQLGNLSNLHTLDLEGNENVSSETVEWLSHLSSLRYLNMSRVDLSKAVDWPRSLSKLTSLTELQLYTCHLLDVDLSSFSFINSSTSLQYLELSFNFLNSTSIFDWIANFSPNLVHLYLSDNQLQGTIPDVFNTSMLSLVTLDVSENKLKGGIPKGFENLCSLESLLLMDNQFSGNIEDSIKALSCSKNTLETLNLGGNQFWGSIPEMIGFSKLKVFNLYSNALNGSLPESFGKLSTLEVLSLSGNSMTGAITESHFQNLSHLQSLDLSGNRFSINLSSDWNPPFQLTGWLTLSSNKLGPAIPKWILKQTNLTQLEMSNAGISGSLPDRFWDIFPGLYEIDLSRNQIRGELPNMSTATSLNRVNLSYNLFSGAVPSFPPKFGEFDLSNNMFSNLLSSLCASNADSIKISDNLLSGELPNCWMQSPDLQLLDLGNNKLSGKLPSSLGNLKSIVVLRLKDNNFSGELPSLKNCTKLGMVDLGNNNLSGKIPTWIGQSLANLVVLRLHSNQFDGIIPFSLCRLGGIHVLDLSHNNISGALPHCLNNVTALADDIRYLDASMVVELIWKGIDREFGNNLRHLRSIDISGNSLVGQIPESITSMENLKSLNLSGNYFMGNLPGNFGNMKNLESLDLSRNQISGEIPASFSKLNFLSVLDLSHNHLSGRIPLGTQLQSFNASAYMGNLALCGPPLTPNCSENGTTQADDDIKEHDNDGLISLGFIISTVLGFVSGFWIVCGSLLLKSSWRYAYFKFLDDSRDWIYVKMAVYKAKMQRRLQR